MDYLWLGVLLFGGVHVLFMALPSLRAILVGKLGENGFKGLYSLISVVGLAALAKAYLVGRSGPASLEQFYQPLDGARQVMMVLVLVGFILIFSNKSKGYIGHTLRHPFSIGVALWAIGHLLVNGERAVVVIFAMFLFISLLYIALSVARGKGPTHQPQLRYDVRSMVVGMVLYVVFALGFHPYVLNIPVM